MKKKIVFFGQVSEAEREMRAVSAGNRGRGWSVEMRYERPVPAWSAKWSWEFESATQAPLQLMQTYLLSTQKAEQSCYRTIGHTFHKRTGIVQ